jgi:hypothetical protein
MQHAPQKCRKSLYRTPLVGDRRVHAQWSLVEERRGGKSPTRAERLEQIREAGGPQSLWIHRDARVAWEAILNGGESGRESDSE